MVIKFFLFLKLVQNGHALDPKHNNNKDVYNDYDNYMYIYNYIGTQGKK